MPSWDNKTVKTRDALVDPEGVDVTPKPHAQRPGQASYVDRDWEDADDADDESQEGEDVCSNVFVCTDDPVTGRSTGTAAAARPSPRPPT